MNMICGFLERKNTVVQNRQQQQEKKVQNLFCRSGKWQCEIALILNIYPNHDKNKLCMASFHIDLDSYFTNQICLCISTQQLEPKWNWNTATTRKKKIGKRGKKRRTNIIDQLIEFRFKIQ